MDMESNSQNHAHNSNVDESIEMESSPPLPQIIPVVLRTSQIESNMELPKYGDNERKIIRDETLGQSINNKWKL